MYSFSRPRASIIEGIRRNSLVLGLRPVSPISSRASLGGSEEDLSMEKAASVVENGGSEAESEEVDEEQRKAEKRSQRIDRCFSCARVFLPHVGLVILLALYTLAGAGLFSIIELPHEKRTRYETMRKVWSIKNSMTGELWNLTRYPEADETEFREMALRHVAELENVIWKAFKENIVTDVDLKNGTAQIWTFAASVFFATTGYGHMCPSTLQGKIFCIVFGLFGIPLLLITIADIGKFLSEFITMIYRTYRIAKFQFKKRAHQLSLKRKRTKGPETVTTDSSAANGELSESQEQNAEIHIPVIMVIFFLVAYTALGGLLFGYLEDWDYFSAFYFCFITMATIGFGDLVPTRENYMFITMVYILIGLAITTMCIDLAGTEYIRKIHYFGQKIESAKGVVGGAMVTGLQVGHGFIRSAGGRLLHAAGGDQVMLSAKQAAALRAKYGLPADFDLGEIVLPEGMTEEEYLALHPELSERKGINNVLFQPLTPNAQRLLKPHIKILPDEIGENDAFVLENKVFDRLPKRRRPHFLRTGHQIFTEIRSVSSGSLADQPIYIVPFILKESDV